MQNGENSLIFGENEYKKRIVTNIWPGKWGFIRVTCINHNWYESKFLLVLLLIILIRNQWSCKIIYSPNDMIIRTKCVNTYLHTRTRLCWLKFINEVTVSNETEVYLLVLSCDCSISCSIIKESWEMTSFNMIYLSKINPLLFLWK